MAYHVDRVSRRGSGTLLALGGGFCVCGCGVLVGFCGVLVGFCPVLFFPSLLDKTQQWFISSQKPQLLLLQSLC